MMFPGFSFFTLEPEQDGVGPGEVGSPWEGEVVPLLLVVVGAVVDSDTASTPSIVTSFSVLVE